MLSWTSTSVYRGFKRMQGQGMTVVGNVCDTYVVCEVQQQLGGLVSRLCHAARTKHCFTKWTDLTLQSTEGFILPSAVIYRN
jgi:hypothetical protein